MKKRLVSTGLLAVSALLGSLAPAQAVTVNFTGAEGYANGSLFNNANWASNANANSWIVDSAAGTVSWTPPPTGNGSAIAIYQQALVPQQNRQVSTSITFSMNLAAGAQASPTQVNLAGVNIGTSSSAYPNSTSDNGFVLRLMRNNASEEAAGLFFLDYRLARTDGSLGPAQTIALPDLTSISATDMLQLSLIVVLPETPAGAYQISASFANLTTDTVLGSLTQNTSRPLSGDALFDGPLYASFRAPAIGPATGGSSMVVHSFEATAPIPEAGTIALCLAFAAGLLALRNRKKRN